MVVVIRANCSVGILQVTGLVIKLNVLIFSYHKSSHTVKYNECRKQGDEMQYLQYLIKHNPRITQKTMGIHCITKDDVTYHLDVLELVLFGSSRVGLGINMRHVTPFRDQSLTLRILPWGEKIYQL